MSEAKWSITEAKCLQISHNKYASQRDAISPSMGDLMLSLFFSCKKDTRRCLSWVLTLCQDYISLFQGTYMLSEADLLCVEFLINVTMLADD
jgi:hypothetical protein